MRQPAIGDDAGAHAHRVERVAAADRLPIHRPHHAHRPCARVVLALEPTDAAILVTPHPDRRYVDVEAPQHLRVQPALDLADRVGDALLDRTVVDRGAVARLGDQAGRDLLGYDRSFEIRASSRPDRCTAAAATRSPAPAGAWVDGTTWDAIAATGRAPAACDAGTALAAASELVVT